MSTVLRLDTTAGRGALLAVAVSSGMAFLDGTVVNVALPALGADLHARVSGLQWTITGYTLTLAAFVLLGGALGDRYGRRRVFLAGVVAFTVTSVVCGFAPTIGVLVAARILQGAASALLTPGSLAIIQASFAPGDRARAIGLWSGLAGLASAAGPFVGGALIDHASWRWVFFINVPLALVAIAATLRWVPETSDPDSTGGFDVAGALLGATGLAGLTYALVAAPDQGLTSPHTLGGLAVGAVASVAFVAVERRHRQPMLPPALFADRQFTAINLVTLLVYGALGGVFFFLVVQLQVVCGFSALAAGAAGLPVTVFLLIGSARAGELGQRIGARIPLTVGPLVAAAGVLLLLRIGPEANYLLDVLPATVVFGLGMVILVAPLTAGVLAAAPDRMAGVASGVNNAVARSGSLLAVAALPLMVGLRGGGYQIPATLNRSFQAAMVWCAGLLLGGALIAWLLVSGRPRSAAEHQTIPGAAPDR